MNTAGGGGNNQGRGGLNHPATLRDYLKVAEMTEGYTNVTQQQQQVQFQPHITPDFSALLMSSAATRSTPGSPATFAGGLGFNSVRNSPVLGPSLPQSPIVGLLGNSSNNAVGRHSFTNLSALASGGGQQQQQQHDFESLVNSAAPSATASPTVGAFNRRALLAGMANLNMSQNQQLPPTSINPGIGFGQFTPAGVVGDMSDSGLGMNTAFAIPQTSSMVSSGVAEGSNVGSQSILPQPTLIACRKSQVTATASPEFLQRVESMKSKGLRLEIDGIAAKDAKSRVETQIKITLRLVTEEGERVTCWSHLALPEMLVSREKFRHRLHKQQGETMPQSSQHVVHLSAGIICSGDPTKTVETCMGCMRREYKRSLRRKDSRLRSAAGSVSTTPAQSRAASPSPDSPGRAMTGTMEMDWDENRIEVEKKRIVIFNCNDLLDFSKGELVLPTRITCYCRHHKEKVGFCICFTLKDSQGQVLATLVSPPIMITDDHKSTKFKTERTKTRSKADYERQGDGSAAYANHALASLGGASNLHLVDGATAFKGGRQAMSARNSPTMRAYHNPLLDTYSQFASLAGTPSLGNTPIGSPMLTAANIGGFESHFNLPQAAAGGAYHTAAGGSYHTTPIASGHASFLGGLTASPNSTHISAAMAAAVAAAATTGATAGLSPLSRKSSFSNNNNGTSPQITHIMPAQGPVAGGTSVIISGHGFHQGMAVYFGRVQAAQVQVLSSSNIACTLPPTMASGPAPVQLRDLITGSVCDASTVIFSYTEDTDQAMLDLSLHVIGLRPLTTSRTAQSASALGLTTHTSPVMQQRGSVSPSSADSSTQILQDATAVAVLRALRQASEQRNLVEIEANLVRLLAMLAAKGQLDSTRLAARHEASGRGLVHFAALLGMTALLSFLATRGVPLDSQDNNGLTALHFACMLGRAEVVERLLNSGASHAIRSVLQQTPADIARESGHHQVQMLIEERDGYMSFIKEDQVAEPSNNPEQQQQQQQQQQQFAGLTVPHVSIVDTSGAGLMLGQQSGITMSSVPGLFAGLPGGDSVAAAFGLAGTQDENIMFSQAQQQQPQLNNSNNTGNS